MGCQPSKVSVRFAEELVIRELSGKKCFFDKYTLGQRLGKGTFGAVYSAVGPAGGQEVCDVAVKVLRLADPGWTHSNCAKAHLCVQREIGIMRALPNSELIVRFYDAWMTKEAAYLVMEKCSMDLLPALQSMPDLTEETLKPILRDMLLALAACHTVNIVHRDVKPDNFLTVPDADGAFSTKLCDFGLSARVIDAESPQLCGVCGTPPFMAPEMLAGERYAAKVDVWSVGVIAHALLFGRWPYMPVPLTTDAMKGAIRVGFPPPRFQALPGLPQVSGPACFWVQALLNRKPLARPSATRALAMDGFQGDWDDVDCLRPVLEAAISIGLFLKPVPASNDDEPGIVEL